MFIGRELIKCTVLLGLELTAAVKRTGIVCSKWKIIHDMLSVKKIKNKLLTYAFWFLNHLSLSLASNLSIMPFCQANSSPSLSHEIVLS